MSMLMGGFTWWAFEILPLLVGNLHLDFDKIDAIVLDLVILAIVIPIGLNKACYYFVGYYLGQGCEVSLRHYYNVAMVMSCIVGTLKVILFWGLHDYILQIFMGEDV